MELVKLVALTGLLCRSPLIPHFVCRSRCVVFLSSLFARRPAFASSKRIYPCCAPHAHQRSPEIESVHIEYIWPF